MFKDLFPVSKKIFVTKTNRLILTYFLTPWSRVLHDKLTCFQLVKKLPAFYWTRRFITAFTSAPHLSLSWAASIQSITPHPTSWRSILILSSHIRLGLLSGLFPSVFSTKIPAYAAVLPHTGYMPRRSSSSQFLNLEELDLILLVFITRTL